MKRKIAANYIFLPGFPLVKNGYAVWEDGNVTDVVVRGTDKEIQDWNFTGGACADFVGRLPQDGRTENVWWRNWVKSIRNFPRNLIGWLFWRGRI